MIESATMDCTRVLLVILRECFEGKKEKERGDDFNTFVKNKNSSLKYMCRTDIQLIMGYQEMTVQELNRGE